MSREEGISTAVERALDDLAKKVDVIYLTVDIDMDALDSAYVPKVPAKNTGLIRTDELFECVYITDSYSLVQAIDIVCLDSLRNRSSIIVKSGVHVISKLSVSLVERK
ncbi:arginase family protein [Priestia filamentosa]|uniref:arginase family protein n=1 Tax=Priestia filamentosa TaxID=1402861 RepID=UPI00205F30A7|nr:arginase family protein [Priestia filamentosa]